MRFHVKKKKEKQCKDGFNQITTRQENNLRMKNFFKIGHVHKPKNHNLLNNLHSHYISFISNSIQEVLVNWKMFFLLYQNRYQFAFTLLYIITWFFLIRFK